MKDGLVSNTIVTLFQDSQGLLWIGTVEGLSVFNGTFFTNYTVANGLRNSFINHIYESTRSPGTIWLATNGGGILKYKDGAFTTILTGKDEWSNRVNDIMEDRNGVLWCSTDNGIFLIQNDRMMPFDIGFDFGVTFSIRESGSLYLWIAGERGLCRYLKPSRDLKVYDIKLPFQTNPMFVSRNGYLWVVTSDSGVLQIQGDKILGRYPMRFPDFHSISEDKEGCLLVATEQGLYKIRRTYGILREVARYTMMNGLPENYILSTLIDKENNLWFGCFRKGLLKVIDGVIKFPMNSRIAGNNSYAVNDFNNHYWINAGDGVTELWSDADGIWYFQVHAIHENGRPDFARSVVLDSLGRLWIMLQSGEVRQYEITSRGARSSRLHLLQRFLPGRDVPHGGPMCFVVDKNYRLWYSLGNKGGLHVVDPRRRNHRTVNFSHAHGIQSFDIVQLYEDREERMWLGCYLDGLFVYPLKESGNRIFQLDSMRGLPDGSIRSLLQDQQNRIWIGTRYGGIVVLDGQMRRTISIPDGLLSNAVWNIAQDRHGAYWIGTELGLMSLKNWESGDLQTHPELVGFPIMSIGISRDEKIWASSSEAFFVYDYYGQNKKPLPPPITITRLEVNHRSVAIRHDMQLAYGENDLLLEYVGTGFCGKGEMRYQYRLVPNEAQWQPASTQRSVHFSALRAGTYTFIVQAINKENVQSKTPAMFSFTIAPPYWEQWWFYTLVLFFVTALTTVITRLYVHQKILVERVRMQIASDLHDEVGSTLSGINIFSDMAKRELDTKKTKEIIGRIGTSSQEMLDAMDDIVWLIHPRNDSLANLIQRVRKFSSEMFEACGIAGTFDLPPEIERIKLSMEVRRNIFLILKETINNIVKHSQCTQVVVSLLISDGCLLFRVNDNGVGINNTETSSGNGLLNMKKRAEAIGGMLNVVSQTGNGTTISLKIKIT